MEAVRGINIPMYTTLRRTTVAFTMIMEYFLSGKKHSSFVLGRYSILTLSFYLCGIKLADVESFGWIYNTFRLKIQVRDQFHKRVKIRRLKLQLRLNFMFQAHSN
jgi:hypothetical protein